MGDRTALQVIVHHAHPDEVSDIFNALAHYHLERDTRRGIELGDLMLAEEVSCGCSDELASLLESCAPQSSFTIWEDPKYEWLGSLNLLTPELGRFTAECDANGRAVFTETEVQNMVANHTGTDLADNLMRASGAAWRRVLESIDGTFAGQTIRPKEDA